MTRALVLVGLFVSLAATIPTPPSTPQVVRATLVASAPPTPTPAPTPVPTAPRTPESPGPPESPEPTRSVSDTVSSPGILALGERMAAEREWTGHQWTALKNLWMRESGWNPRARNRRSGACGIPQRHPCRGLSSLPPAEQIAWGLQYVAERYGTPAAAWVHFLRRNWY